MKGFYPPPLKCRVKKGEERVKGLVFGSCLECVWKVSGKCVEGANFLDLIFSRPKFLQDTPFFLKTTFFLCQIFWNLQFLQIIFKSQICSGP